MGFLQKYLSRYDNYMFHATTTLFKRKIGLLPPLLKLYCIYLFTKRSPLRLLDIAITRQCQYRCPHCYPEGFYKKKNTELSVEEIINTVRQGQEMGIVQFNFQGGEPTLDLDRLEHIVSSINPERHYISLSSNGFRHTREDLRRIRKMGVDKIALSLHSGIPEEHNNFVGSPKAYDKVISGLAACKAVGLEATLASTVTRDTVRSDGFSKVVELCLRLGIILDVNVAMPAGRWAGMTESLLRSEDYAWLAKLNHKHPNIRRDLHPHLFRKGCPAGKELLYINVYGDVLACPFLHFSPGNIRRHPLADLQARILSVPWFAEYNPQCLACENEEFLFNYMEKTFNSASLPLSFSEFFAHKIQN